MTITTNLHRPAPRATRPDHSPAKRAAVVPRHRTEFVCGSQAVDFGPFSLTGFAKAASGRVSDYCEECQ